MSKKTVVIIASTFIGLLILLIFVLWILSITKHKYYTYQEVEQKLIEAAKTFYKENPEILPVNDGRSTRPDLHIGVCGETGGEPKSIDFYHNAGLDYVSCSPFRVPVARLAAAQANSRNPRK